MIELLHTRRSVPPMAMSGPGPSAGELDELLTVAARVPDHGKLAPWRFIIFEGEGRVAAGRLIAEAFLAEHPQAEAERVELERKRLSHAPLVVAVVSCAAPHEKIPEWEQVLSAGAVCMNVCHAAHALGYAANWLTDWFAYDSAARPVLGLKEGERIAGFVYLGTPVEPPQERPRPGLTDIVTRWNGG